MAPVDTSIPVEQAHAFQINFNSLYTALCEHQCSDQATLLLYTLLHQNANMRTYMLSRTDMDNLVGTEMAKSFNKESLAAFSYSTADGVRRLARREQLPMMRSWSFVK